jgi:hypothetical protein
LVFEMIAFKQYTTILNEISNLCWCWNDYVQAMPNDLSEGSDLWMVIEMIAFKKYTMI